MQTSSGIIDVLREIEHVTSINGCFLLRAQDNAVIESTIPQKIHDDILWEIAVLRDTFQQFAQGINHGALNDITLEADRGFIFVYNLPPHFILLAIGQKSMNLGYLQLAMVDIIRRLKEQIAEIGEELLKGPIKEFAAVGAEAAFPTLLSAEGRATQKAVAASSKAVSAARMVAEARAAKAAATPAIGIVEPTRVPTGYQIEPEEAPIPEMESETPTILQVSPEEISEISAPEEIIAKGPDIRGLIESIKGKPDKAKYAILQDVFNLLKSQVKVMTGAALAELLEVLKDMILEECGTSLALFDISKNARDFRNVQEMLSPQQVLQMRDRIDNWIQRIVK